MYLDENLGYYTYIAYTPWINWSQAPIYEVFKKGMQENPKGENVLIFGP